ncbi:sensor histidine kinase [Pedobacter deserti]|uniref:sensor histidine kinase n=1 Tax=Pedobacter deserti TaxID=2817382 RepID=UPI0021095AFE|nr:histidine kinase [Pedobacter sp. SYSU D00382]
MTLTTRSKVLLRHILAIIAYFSYEVGMLYAYTGEMVYFTDALWHLMVNLCLFYTIALTILPAANRQDSQVTRIAIGAVLLLLAFLGFFVLKYLLSQLYALFSVETTRPYVEFLGFLRDTLWRFINISGLSFGYWFAANALEKQREVANLEQQRLTEQLIHETARRELIAIENDLLKSKINHHFLFNTLNYLRNTIKKVDMKAGEALLGLSDIFHYTLSTPADGRVNLSEELNYVRAVFNISKLKSRGNLFVDFSVTGDPGNLQIIPLVLITLCENMLKYAELSDPDHPARFECVINDQTLKINISNKKRAQKNPISYGIGMRNTEKRLALAYGDSYHLKINQTLERYQLTLTIHLL